jgi:hypothetical protein
MRKKEGEIMANQVLDCLKTRPQAELYIALEDLDFSWYESEIDRVIEMWQRGAHIEIIANTLKRTQEEVLILLLDLAMRDKIKLRYGSVWGCEYDSF